MGTTVLIIYCAIAIRAFIAVRLNDFKKPQYRLFIEDEAINRRASAHANVLVFSVTLFWPIFFVIQPTRWVRGFIFGEKLAINLVCFNFGRMMGRFFCE